MADNFRLKNNVGLSGPDRLTWTLTDDGALGGGRHTIFDHLSDPAVIWNVELGLMCLIGGLFLLCLFYCAKAYRK